MCHYFGGITAGVSVPYSNNKAPAGIVTSINSLNKTK
jgi:hypothetical protein